MATRIRLQRNGRKSYAFYSIVIADVRAPRDGKFTEKIGTYNPNTHPATVDLNFERGVKKGAFDEAACAAKFEAWKNAKTQKTDAAKAKVADAKKADVAARLEAEKKVNETIAKKVADKKAAEALAKAEAEAAAKAEAEAAEAPAEEAAATEEAPAEA